MVDGEFTKSLKISDTQYTMFYYNNGYYLMRKVTIPFFTFYVFDENDYYGDGIVNRGILIDLFVGILLGFLTLPILNLLLV